MADPAEKRPRLVVGEEDRVTGEAVIRALSHDHDILWAKSGVQVLELAQAEPRPDLILVDAHVPVMDGFALCKSLAVDERTRELPIILIREADEDGASTYEAGAAEHVRKPIDEVELRARVRIQLELKRLRELTGTALALDPLTDVADQQGVEEFIDLEWRRAAREATSLSVILVRIDYFQGLVASRGRETADDSLRHVASELAASIRRPMDFIGRYDEDGFAVVLPVTEAYGASYLGDLMRQQIETLTLPNPGSTVSNFVTVSAGVSTAVPFPASEPDALITAAARGLELAVLRGGNRVRTVEPVLE